MPNENPLIMTMDFGTQSVRASIYNDKGEAIAYYQKHYEPAYFSKEKGFAEQDPNYYFACLCECTNAITKEYPDLIKDVKGITLTCFRDSAVLLDKDRKVIRPMILWLDQRFAVCKEPLPALYRLIFAVAGKTAAIEINRRRTIANWVKENEPENWAKVDKYVQVNTYFNYLLTGELKDPASANIGHYPLEYKKRQWYKKPMKHMQGMVFSVEKQMLSEIVPAGTLIGKITEEASKLTGIPAGIPLYACGADKSCETLGTGVVDDTMASISLGTAASIETTTVKYKPGAPFFPAYPSVQPGRFNMDRQVYRGFWMINWFLKEFGAKNIDDVISENYNAGDYNKEIASIPPGCDGLILQPYWGPMLERPLVKGAVIGFTDSTTKAHFYKAIIEGVLFALYEGMQDFTKRLGHGFKELRISGGGSRSDEVCQIAADMFGLPVSRVQTNESSSLGAAISGFLSIGRYNGANQAVSQMVRKSVTFTPNQENHKKYADLYNKVYKKLYPSLKDVYKTICEMNKK
ncbi:MAG: FGGY-family carbohydrate kinase [Bacilli bacterium]|nr:FGGY-family carbohydrate kinase [Bacilli bacterium]